MNYPARSSAKHASLLKLLRGRKGKLLSAERKLILLTNDDGVHAEGLQVLRRAVEPLGEVIVCAPDRPRSASGHAITLHKPLRVAELQGEEGRRSYAMSGTPSDCVVFAFSRLLPRIPDLVLSGINDGPNLGWDLTYSGTVSAAMEGAMLGASSVALSLVRAAGKRVVADFGPAAHFAADLAALLLETPLPATRFLNVNVPQTPEGHIAGARVTRQGVRRYPVSAEERVDPWGRKYYWLGSELPIDELVPGTDVEAVASGHISITPLQLDLTDHALKEEIAQRADVGSLVQRWFPKGDQPITPQEEEELLQAIRQQDDEEEFTGE